MNNFILKIMPGLLYIFLSFYLKADQVNLLLAYEDKHNFPFYMGKGEKINWKKPGLSVELLKRLEAKLNLKVSFKRQPWDRCKIDLQNGKVDGIFNASFKYNRLILGAYPTKNNQIDPSRRITTIAYVVYVLKESKLRWDLVHKRFYNLKGRIGAPRGYSIIADLEKWKIPVEPSLSTFIDFKKMMQKRLAAVAALELAGDHYLNKGPKEFKNIKKLQPPLVVKHYYLMLSHQFVEKKPELAEKIWDNIRELREAEFNKLGEKYFLN